MRKALIALVLILALFIASAWAEDITFPPACDTTEEQLEYLTEMKEKLRLWHNQRTAGMNTEEIEAFFRDEFHPKIKAIEASINKKALFVWDAEIRVNIKNTPAVPETPKWNPDIGGLLNSVSKPIEAKKGA